MKTTRWVAFDTETHPFAPGRKAPRMVCLTWCDHTGAYGIVKRAEGLALIRKWLLDTELIIVGHNVAFDLAVCIAGDPQLSPLVWAAYDAGRIRDTGVHEMLRKIRLGRFGWCPIVSPFRAKCGQKGKAPFFGLFELVWEHFGRDISAGKKKGPDVWRTRYNELEHVPLIDWPKAATKYAVDDARWTAALHNKQLENVEANYIEQVRNAWGLHLGGCWGLRTEWEYVRRLRKHLVERVGAARPRLVQAGIMAPRRTFDRYEIECGLITQADFKESHKEIRRRINLALGPVRAADPDNRTDPSDTHAAGQLKMDAETIYKTDDEALLVYAGIKKDLKELQTYMPVIERGTTYPINPFFRPLVASGRTGCVAPNVQNLPRRPGVRECYVPRDGWAYLFCDYKSAELVGLAQVCLDSYKWSNLADVFRPSRNYPNGRDPHLVTAAALTRRTYDKIAGAHKAGEQWAKDSRQLCKIANFGYPGGLMPPTFIDYARGQTRDENGKYPDYIRALDIAASTSLRSVTVGAYPEWEQMFTEAKAACPRGRGKRGKRVQHRSGRVRGGLSFTSWCNTGFQGIVADGAKLALYAVQRECWNVPTSPLYGCRVVNFIHDEIMLECPIEQLHEAHVRLEAVMIWAMRQYIPDVPVRVDSAATYRWYKGADPVFVNGRLVPGEPYKVGKRKLWRAAPVPEPRLVRAA